MADILWYIQWWQLSALTTAAPLAQELRERGHSITFLSTEAASAPLRDLGFGFRPERRLPVHDWGRRDRMPAPLTSVTVEFRHWALALMPARMREVADALESHAYDLVVTDGRLLGAGPGFAAERAGLPWVAYVDCVFDDRLPVGPPAPAWNSLRAQMGLGPERRPARERRWFGMSPHLTLLFGLPALSCWSRAPPGYVQQVGPLTWDQPLSDPPPLWLDDLGRERPAILISTSSACLGDGQLVALVADALQGEAVDLVATVPANQPMPSPPGNVRVIPYFPHSLLLPKVRLVICSAGLGVISRALLAGIPVLATPWGADGHMVAQAAAKTGAALAFDPLRAEGGSVRAMVMRCLGECRQRSAAQDIARAATRVSAAAEAAARIERLLA